MQPRGWSELGRTVTVQRGSSDRGSESPGAGEERGRASQQLTVAGCRVEAVCRAEQSAELVRNTEDSRLSSVRLRRLPARVSVNQLTADIQNADNRKSGRQEGLALRFKLNREFIKLH